MVPAADVPHRDASDAGDYIRQRRLLLAAEALRTTQRPIFDIAMDLGYVSQQTFSRVFRREFDRTPSDYRHQISA